MKLRHIKHRATAAQLSSEWLTINAPYPLGLLHPSSVVHCLRLAVRRLSRASPAARKRFLAESQQ